LLRRLRIDPSSRVTATASIAAIPGGETPASRAALKALPTDVSAMFAELLSRQQATAVPAALRMQASGVGNFNAEDAEAGAEVRGGSRLVGPAVGTDLPGQVGAHAGAGTATGAINTDQALLAQLKSFLAKDSGTEGTATPETKPVRAAAETNNDAVAAIPTNLLQQILAKIGQPVTSGGGATAHPMRGTSEAPAATVDDAKDAAEPLKALSGATDLAKHQAAPAQTTVAKALPLHIEAANGGQQQPSGNNHQQNPQQQHDQPTAAPDSAKALQAAATAEPATPQAAAHPSTAAPSAVEATQAAAVQAAQPVAHTAPSLHVAQQQIEVSPQPDLGALAVNIATRSKNGEKHFDIRLDPPELGRVDVRLTIDDAGKAQANLAAEKPHTLELLQRDRTHLERALRDAGLDLAGGGLNFSLRGQDRETGDTPRGRALSASLVTQTDTSTPLGAHTLPIDTSRLDIRV
jgi:flagellar hook-length control protein FliK